METNSLSFYLQSKQANKNQQPLSHHPVRPSCGCIKAAPCQLPFLPSLLRFHEALQGPACICSSHLRRCWNSNPRSMMCCCRCPPLLRSLRLHWTPPTPRNFQTVVARRLNGCAEVASPVSALPTAAPRQLPSSGPILREEFLKILKNVV